MSPIRFRQSLMKTWQGCALQARFQELDGLPRPQASKAAFGTIIHYALKQYELAGGNLDVACKTFLEVWDDPAQVLGREIDVWNKFTTFAGLRTKGLEILRTYDEQKRWNREQVIVVEHHFLVPFGAHELEGTVDKLDLAKNHQGHELLRVVDYKPLHVDTLVLTPLGWVKLGDIHVGDRVVGSDGHPTTVVGEADQGVLPAFRIRFNDGTSAVCAADHRWAVTDLYGKERVLAVSEFGTLWKAHNHRYFVPTAAPVEFDQGMDLPIPPYTLGVLLADGSLLGTVSVCRPDLAVRERVEAELAPGLHIVEQDWKSWRITRDASHGANQYTTALRGLGLWGCRSWEKFIPAPYLQASVADRTALLAGLMDCDGGSSSRTDYRTSSALLRDGVIELCRSLGGVPTTGTYPGYYLKDGHRIEGRDCHIVVPRMPFNPFFLARKAATWTPPRQRQNRAIVAVEPCGDLEMRCIKVAAADGLFVIDGYVVTHNTNTRKPTVAELRLDVQFSTYVLATLQPEFWLGNGPDFPPVPNGEWWWSLLQNMPRRGIWVQLWDRCQEIDAGPRDDDDFGRLYRLCNEIERAIDAQVFIPCISGDTCTFCSFANGPCPTRVPDRAEWETTRIEDDATSWA